MPSTVYQRNVGALFLLQLFTWLDTLQDCSVATRDTALQAQGMLLYGHSIKN